MLSCQNKGNKSTINRITQKSNIAQKISLIKLFLFIKLHQCYHLLFHSADLLRCSDIKQQYC